MSTSQSVPAAGSQRGLETRLVKLYLQVLLEMRATHPSSVQMEPSGEHFRIRFIGADGQTELKVIELPAALAAPTLTFMLDRVIHWPDANDELFVSSQAPKKRILLAPPGPNRLQCDFQALRKPGSNGTHISLNNILTDGIQPIGQRLLLDRASQERLERIGKQRTGIVFVQATQKPHAIDASAVLFAMRPDAIFYRLCSSEVIAVEALETAESHFVIVSMPHEDPIEMLLGFRNLLTKAEHTSVFSKSCLGSFIHNRVRRVCGACSRSTPVDPRTLDRLPMQLRPKAKNTYFFGRGCEQCGHSAYLGTVGISSILEVDEGFRSMLSQSRSVNELTRYAYQHGTGALLEDGLAKIFSGLTSFEEVFAVTTKISSGFASSIAAADSSASGDQPLPLEGVNTDALLGAEDPSKPHHTSGKRCIMIVEDDDDQRAVLENIFRAEGYEVVGAENGKAALTALDGRPVDIIVCDVMMPVMNGAQFVKQLRATETLKHLPVLMLTAVSNPDAECALLSHGADDYCEKNVKRKILLKRVEKLLTRGTTSAKKPLKNPLEHMLKE